MTVPLLLGYMTAYVGAVNYNLRCLITATWNYKSVNGNWDLLLNETFIFVISGYCSYNIFKNLL